MLDDDKMWKLIKNISINTEFEEGCDFGFYSNMTAQVEAVERSLNTYPSEDILGDISDETLKKAAKIFIYLNPCVDLMRPWISFYKDLFQNKSPDIILLTLNRILKTKNSKDDLHEITKKIFRKTASIFSLKYKEIRNMTTDTNVLFTKIDNNPIKMEGGCVCLRFNRKYLFQ